MANEKQLPTAGDRLVHRFRKGRDQVVAEVLSVDKQTWKVTVRVAETTYASLSAAAHAFSENEANGWVFWGLKKQVSRRRKD